MAAHTFNPTILREYDIRGVVGQTLHEADAAAIGRSFDTGLQVLDLAWHLMGRPKPLSAFAVSAFWVRLAPSKTASCAAKSLPSSAWVASACCCPMTGIRPWTATMWS